MATALSSTAAVKIHIAHFPKLFMAAPIP